MKDRLSFKIMHLTSICCLCTLQVSVLHTCFYLARMPMNYGGSWRVFLVFLSLMAMILCSLCLKPVVRFCVVRRLGLCGCLLLFQFFFYNLESSK